MSFFLRQTMIAFLYFSGLGTLMVLFLRWLSGDHFLPARLGGYFLPWFLLLLLPGTVFAVITARKWLILVLGLPTLWIFALYFPLFMPAPAPAAAVGSLPLKVMSFNVWSHNSGTNDMARVIIAESPDLILLQEIDAGRLAVLRSALAGLYPGGTLHFSCEPQMMQAVISRYPVTPLEELHHRGQAQIVAVDTPAGRLKAINVHPLRDRGWEKRYRQIASLLEEEIVGDPVPIILAGDFNANEQTQLYRQVTTYLKDAHWQAGRGFGFSFPAPASDLLGVLPLPPMIRIDHIFFNADFEVKVARTLADSGGSDHFPVIAELLLLPKVASRPNP